MRATTVRENTTEITELWNGVKNSYRYHAHKRELWHFPRRFKNKPDKQRGGSRQFCDGFRVPMAQDL